MATVEEAEIERLQAAVASAEKVCDSYADENQRFHDEIERLRAVLDRIGAMFYVGVGGAVLLKPDFGNYDVLDAVNAALADQQLQGGTK